MGKLKRICVLAKERGADWCFLFGLRTLGLRGVRKLDRALAKMEMARMITGELTVSREYHTVQDNKRWDSVDWSNFGEEWTLAVQDYRGLNPAEWKDSLVKQYILPYTVRDGHTLEIGPGAGRWTAILVGLCATLTVADLNATCLDLCCERFKKFETIRYYQVLAGAPTFLPPEIFLAELFDFVWSYDVFVHINANDIGKYLADFARVMKPNAVAVIHHAGDYAADKRPGTRSFMNAPLFAHLAGLNGFEVLVQNTEMPHFPGDVLSVIRKR